MAKGAPTGNQFWKMRNSHGRARLFKTPKAMFDAACEYFQWCEDNPLYEVDFKGKDAIEVHIPKMRAFTIHGLCIYLNCNTKYFNDFYSNVSGKKDRTSKGFSDVITRIREIIYTQKFTGAAAGFLNPNIIARDLGLTDKQEIKHEGEIGVSDFLLEQ
jgi:hypothetical protein